MSKIFTRNCPKCGNPIMYRSQYLLDWASEINDICKPCKKAKLQRNCPSCNNVITYRLRQSLEYGIKNNTICWECKRNRTFQRNCPKCNDVITYTLKRSCDYDSEKNRNCSKCREEERLQKKTRICPLCQKVIIHKSSSIAFHAKRNNQPCKKCSARIEADKQLESETIKWTEIFGVIPKRQSTYNSWKQLWYHRLSEEQRKKVLGLTTQQKIYFWGHIRRWSRAKAIRDAKAVFVKWRGDNHWMKRPEVLQKVIKSCIKYRGDHHWFRLEKV